MADEQRERRQLEAETNSSKSNERRVSDDRIGSQLASGQLVLVLDKFTKILLNKYDAL